MRTFLPGSASGAAGVCFLFAPHDAFAGRQDMRERSCSRIRRILPMIFTKGITITLLLFSVFGGRIMKARKNNAFYRVVISII